MTDWTGFLDYIKAAIDEEPDGAFRVLLRDELAELRGIVETRGAAGREVVLTIGEMAITSFVQKLPKQGMVIVPATAVPTPEVLASLRRCYAMLNMTGRTIDEVRDLMAFGAWLDQQEGDDDDA